MQTLSLFNGEHAKFSNRTGLAILHAVTRQDISNAVVNNFPGWSINWADTTDREAYLEYKGSPLFGPFTSIDQIKYNINIHLLPMLALTNHHNTVELFSEVDNEVRHAGFSLADIQEEAEQLGYTLTGSQLHEVFTTIKQYDPDDFTAPITWALIGTEIISYAIANGITQED